MLERVLNESHLVHCGVLRLVPDNMIRQEIRESLTRLCATHRAPSNQSEDDFFAISAGNSEVAILQIGDILDFILMTFQ